MIAQAAPDDDIKAIMLKDRHLLTAALAADQRVVALDEKVRGHFSMYLRDLKEVMRIVWVNPTIVEKTAIDWLLSGAPLERKRHLRSKRGAK
jgi:hypothetical protein